MKSISLLLLFSLLLLARAVRSGNVNNQRTLAMVKPDGMLGNYLPKIKKIIEESGFSILEEKMMQLDVNNVTLFYSEHVGKIFFPNFTKYMTSGPVYAMVLEKPNAISDWRALIGPTDVEVAKAFYPNSIRAMCGTDLQRNCVHGSDSPISAAREISFFFQEQVTGEAAKHDEL